MAKKTEDLIMKSIQNSAQQTDVPVSAATNDVTAQKQAKSKKQVDAQDSRTRIWQSLSTTYNKRKEDSNQQYDLNRNAADRAALQRGMGRSSYNLATMANIDTEKARAADQIDKELIADYQSRINDLDAQERDEAFKREQFQYQKDADKQQIAIQYINNMLQNGGTPSDDLLKQAGISRKDYEQMKKKNTVVYRPKPTGDTDKSGGPSDKGLLGDLGQSDDTKETTPQGFNTVESKKWVYRNGRYVLVNE